MKHQLQKLALMAALPGTMILTGCMDDKYDLSDIDTTIGVQVNDLTIPVNLDAITLSSIFDLDDESVLKEVDGNYAVLIDGDFHSSDIKVNKVILGAPSIAPISTQMVLFNGLPSITLPSLGINEAPFVYDIPEESTSFFFSTAGVDKSIRSIEQVGVNWTITLHLKVNDTNNTFKSFNLSGVQLKLPKGLTTPGHNNVDGVISLPEINLGQGVKNYDLVIPVTRVDFTALSASEYTFTPDPTMTESGTIEFNGSIAVLTGKVTGVADLNATIPSTLGFNIEPVMTDITINTFSGMMDYTLDAFNVESVELNDLPELLTDPGTNVALTNPQLYVSINNPMANYGVKAFSGLSLTPSREGVQGTTASLNPGQLIEIGYDKGIAGPYNFCLSPSQPSAYLKGQLDGKQIDYTGATHVGYTALSDVLAGDGLPSKIGVDFTNARIGSANGPAHVQDFVLGEPLDDVTGSYTFYAPLQFNPGSKIGYDDIEDGWYDDTLAKINIKGVRLRANVSNGLPFDVKLTGYPVTLGQRQCVDPVTKRPVKFNEITIPAGKTAPIDLYCEGTVTELDGIRYIASGVVTDGNITLKPESPLKLTDIRVTVDGSYIDEL